ncbi:MAG: PQQ-binding-like beta-propeller repeat protein [Candidatus Puniceispirillales bacterium WSBS_2018_MAG_OTU23]
MTRLSPLLIAFAGLFLAACSSDEIILPGERIAIISAEGQYDLSVDSGAAVEGAMLPQAVANKVFAAAGQNAAHSGGHFTLTSPLNLAFNVNVGITAELGTEVAQPVATAKAVYTITPGGVLRASDLQSGALIWLVDIDPSEDDTQPAGTGGLAVMPDSSTLFAHANKSVLVALSADDGQEKWRVEFDEFLSGGPTAENGVVIVSDLDGRLFALSAIDGEELWNRIGASDDTGIVGAASPAIFGNQVINAGSDGELLSLSLEDGGFNWGENLTPIALRTAIDGIVDIRAHPVHDGGFIYAISHSGTLYAFNAETGRIVWEKGLQGLVMPWVSGQTVFVVTIDGRVYALRRSDGAVRWVTVLPGAYNPALSIAAGTPSYTSVLVGSGKVIVASSLGQLHVLDADTGNQDASLSTGGAVSTSPIIASNTVFVINRSGALLAFR